MKKQILLFLFLLATGLITQAQTILYTDNFETVNLTWTLNTGAGDNQWVINNSYVGFSPLIPDTPDQPSGVFNFPHSSYLHITNDTACTDLAICNANFDNGSASQQYAEMNADISTTGYTSVTFSFYFLCVGGITSYGTLQYSTDGGTTWNVAGNNLVSQPNWTMSTVTNPSFDNQATLRFRFQWKNGSGSDPSAAVDEISISGMTSSGGQTIVGGAIAPTSFCAGSSVAVPFTASGFVLLNNVFTAQLSNSSGSFASPIAIGTLNGPVGDTITGVIPSSTPPGSGYRIRVIASAPPTIGSDNGTDLSIGQGASATFSPFNPDSVCVNDPPFTLTGGSPAGGTYSGAGVSGGMFDPSVAGVGPHVITYTYVDSTCGNSSATQTIGVSSCALTGLEDVEAYGKFLVYPNPSPGNLVFEYNFSRKFNNGEIQITNALGQVVETLKIEFQSGNAVLEKNLPAGLYNYSLIVDDKRILTEKIIVW